MINLSERLSEFSYGYGATKEVENLLSSVGIKVTPFLPSLIHEKTLGFDVAFERPGRPLFLQFKLGQVLSRFVRRDLRGPAPRLDRPFHRFNVDTAEPDGQFEMLLKSEVDGAEVYYVAPRFSEWREYSNHFSDGQVLQNSILSKPSWIRHALDSKGEPDGIHRVAYDAFSAYVCSQPVELREVKIEELQKSIHDNIIRQENSLGEVLKQVYSGFEERSAIRRREELFFSSSIDNGDGTTTFNLTDGREVLLTNTSYDLERFGDDLRLILGQVGEGKRTITKEERGHRYSQLRERARTEEDAYAGAVAMEAFGMGIQTLFLTSWS